MSVFLITRLKLTLIKEKKNNPTDLQAFGMCQNTSAPAIPNLKGNVSHLIYWRDFHGDVTDKH